MIPPRGAKRDHYVRKLKKERLNELGVALIDVLEDLYWTHDSAATTAERVAVEKAIGETISRIAHADKAAEAEAIVRMKELAEARQKQADSTVNLH
jgi:predicted RecB family endonuclease